MPDCLAIGEGHTDDRPWARGPRPSGPDGVIEIGDLRVDPLGRSATRNGDWLILAPTEFELLLVLARNPGRAFSRGELLRAVWGVEHIGHRHTVAVNIGWLRTKLGDSGRMIQPVVGGGYRLVVPRGDR